MLQLYNTLGKKKEEFVPRNSSLVTLYCCGPTVYDFAHIGNFRTYTMTDFLVRILRYLNYPVKYVTNITDVGHLVSDSDSGEDKLEKGARREGKTAWDIAKFYTAAFLADSKNLNLLEPDVRPKPTEHIKDQIEMVYTLIEKGFAYTIDDGIYFDTSKFPSYGALTGQNLEELITGARVEPNPQKKNPTDFALWKFSLPPSGGRRRDMEWESPWGMGFPGWHIECSAMSKKHLGDQIDIHTGGADLIPIHHTNEIAQSEASSGKVPFVKYWVHGQFIMVGGEKMSKSKGNFYRLADIESKGFDPLALRYLYMTASYRAFLNFTWDGLEAASQALKQLRQQMSLLVSTEVQPVKESNYKQKFIQALEDDLNMPKALSVVWEIIKSTTSGGQKKALLLDFDKVLGFDLQKCLSLDYRVPKYIEELKKQRDDFRDKKMFGRADEVRKKIDSAGYSIEDTRSGTVIKKRS